MICALIRSVALQVFKFEVMSEQLVIAPKPPSARTFYATDDDRSLRQFPRFFGLIVLFPIIKHISTNAGGEQVRHGCKEYDPTCR